MRRVFIGFDPDETVALYVLAHSIWRRSRISIEPLILRHLDIERPREPDQSTEFSFTRFLVPSLCDFRGTAVYMDCDMLCRCNIAELFDAADPAADVSVVKHDYTPKDSTKFLGKTQTSYERKNWSSVMVFDNAKCRSLTQDAVNTADAEWLRKMQWAKNIGSLPAEFNHLVGEYDPNPNAKIVHFTRGTPCFAKYRNCEFSSEWYAERDMMLHHNRLGEYSLPEKLTA